MRCNSWFIAIGLALVAAASLAHAADVPAPIDAAALRQTLEEFDLRKVEWPEGAELGRRTSIHVSLTLAEPLASAWTTVQKRLAAQGWKPAPGETPQVTEQYAGGQFVAQGCLLSASLSPDTGDAKRTSVMLQNMGSVDTRKLPRPKGATAVYESAATSIFTCPGSVADAAAFCAKSLAKLGWTESNQPDTATAENPDLAMLTFRHGRAAVSVYVSKAPAQGNKTSVQCTSELAENELPWPADAEGVEFEPSMLRLNVQSRTSIEDLVRFYGQAMKPLGWTMDATLLIVEEKRAIVAFADASYENQLLLRITPSDDGQRRQIRVEPIDRAALRQLAEAEFPPPPSTPSEPEEPAPSETKSLPSARSIALPRDAVDVEYDADDGEIRFKSPAKIRALVKFFKESLLAGGWSDEDGISVVTGNVATLELAGPDEASLSLMIVNTGLGEPSEVTIDVEGLSFDEQPAPGDLAGEPSANEPSNESDEGDGDDTPAAKAEPLRAEDKEGWPIPHDYTQFSQEKSPFRRQLLAVSPSALAAVVAFYRAELPSRGWKELPDAQVAEDRARLEFRGAEGTLVLALAHQNDETQIDLLLKSTEAAKKEGILPKPGKARVIFANDTKGPIKITFGGSPLNVAAGVGTKKPDGPGFDLAPGKYKFQVERRGAAKLDEEITVGADETWGVMIGEFGALPLQVY